MSEGAGGLARIWSAATAFERTLAVVLAVAAPLSVLPLGELSAFAAPALVIAFFWLLARVLRRTVPMVLWRLRRRLIVAYLFIGLVPVVLVALLAGLFAYTVIGQIAVQAATTELDRRTALMISVAEWMKDPESKDRMAALHHAYEVLRPRLPGLQLLHQGVTVSRFPPDSTLEPPPAEWGDAGGLMIRDDLLYLWAHIVRAGERTTAVLPLTSNFLSSLAPNIGQFSVTRLDDELHQSPQTVRLHRSAAGETESSRNRLPDASSGFDIPVQWFTFLPISIWNSPGQISAAALSVRTRPSVILAAIYAQRIDSARGMIPAAILFFSVLFLIVEIIAMAIGISLTRTITGAVHDIYEGTLRVRAGDFTRRIQVKGRDQLAALGDSFNSMTADIERLLKVAKENERLQAELEIARAVQGQLFPRDDPKMPSLKICASCNPARMVSGDYYDYQRIGDSRLSLALGDVAGKGISAALLMATVQAALRTQLRHQPAGPAPVVSELNKFLYAHTSSEKYATFFFCVYDETTQELCYTNAGHLPPILLRKGQPQMLDVNGMVVGAFPFASYTESCVRLEAGDLFVLYTDGVTEPENAYGEQFGEERLIEIVKRTQDRPPEEILQTVIAAVQEWSGEGELQDDLTLVLAKRY